MISDVIDYDYVYAVVCPEKHARESWWLRFVQALLLAKATSLLTSAKAQGLPRLSSGVHVFSVYHTSFVGPDFWSRKASDQETYKICFFLNKASRSSQKKTLASTVVDIETIWFALWLYFVKRASTGWSCEEWGGKMWPRERAAELMLRMWNRYEQIGMVKQYIKCGC